MAGYLAAGGLIKLVNYEGAISAVLEHGIFGPSLAEEAIILHSLMSVSIAVLHFAPMKEWGSFVAASVMAVFVLLSTGYLILVILRNGWSGNCGCFPGVLEARNLAIPLAMDSLVVGLSVRALAHTRRAVKDGVAPYLNRPR